MTFVVTAPSLEGAPHRLVAAPPDRDDPVVRDLVARASEDGYRRGKADGHREAMAARADHADQLTRAVAGALEQAGRDVVSARAALTDEAVELAVVIAEAVLRREPHDGGQAVAETVRGVLDQLADPAPRVHVHPDDRELVAGALAGLDLAVVGDAGLQPGDARVQGGWAEVELTSAAAWAAIREALDVA